MDNKGLAGDGEFMMRVGRVYPDFISQTGNATVQLDLKDFPNDTAASSSRSVYREHFYG